MKLKIYLADLAHKTKLGIGSDTMPLQLGIIAARCLNTHGEKVDIEIFKFVDELEAAINAAAPDIIAFSNYLWNLDFSYKFISAVKKQYPRIIVIYGGPNYPDDISEQINWLANRPLVDFYVYKDGEIAFTALVGEILHNKKVEKIKREKLPSCHALINSEPFFGPLAERLDDLTLTPSPYLLGLMDKFFDQKLLPTMQTNRGCPFSCTYCSEGEQYYNKISRMSLERKTAEVDYIVARAKHTKTLRITDSNFGMYLEDVEFCEYLSKIQKEIGYPEYLACSTGKNQKERVLKCNELLNGAIRFTASVQSLNKTVLENIKRLNISLDEIMALSDQVSDTDTHSYSEIILGLPGDSLEAQKESFSGLMKAGISNITQHQLAMIYGTEMSLLESRQKYDVKSMFRPIQRCVGEYKFNDQKFKAIEVEEICVSNNTLSYDDYLESRRLYLSTGFFYNDRIFGEIHALLRILGLSTWEWVYLIHNEIEKHNEVIGKLYIDFIKDTRNELWSDENSLRKEVAGNIEDYISGEKGGNLIYKYRSKAIIEYFNDLQSAAFYFLRKYLTLNKIDNNIEIIEDLEKYSKWQKTILTDLNIEKIEEFSYDIIKLIKDVAYVRQGGEIEQLRYPTKIKFYHTEKQQDTFNRLLEFYDNSDGGLAMLLARFPIKRLFRTAERIQ